MSVLTTVFALGSRRRVALVAAVMMVVALVAFVPGPAAAHNPGCIIPGQGYGQGNGVGNVNHNDVDSSPHYPYDRDAKSQAFNRNPNLRDVHNPPSLYPEQAKSIHTDLVNGTTNGTTDAPRYSDVNCHEKYN